MASASWTFDLVDQYGNGLTESGLQLASERKLTFQLGAPNVCSFKLPLTSQEAAVVEGGQAYVKAYRRAAGSTVKVLRFYGPVWMDEIDAGGSTADMLSVTAYDPTVYLNHRDTALSGTGDQGIILKTLIDTTQTNDGELGIRTSTANITQSASITLDNTTQRPMIASVVSQFASQLDGCESWVIPIELASGKMCDFYAAPTRGSIKTGVIFAYGDTSFANCISIKRARNVDNIENDVEGYSDALVYRAADLVSVAAVRRLKSRVSFTGETSTAKLTARSLGRLSERYSLAAVAEYEVKPTSRAPQFFDDYDIGDTVIVDFKKGIEFTVSQRVLSAELSVSDQGLEVASTLKFRAVN